MQGLVRTRQPFLRSIIGLMMLGASQGSTIELMAEGPEARPAMDALLRLIEAKFHEDA